MPFIVIEAINAAGKTTQFNLLIQALKKAGYKVHQYHFHQRDQATGQLIEHKFLHNRTSQARFTRREQALLYIQDFFTRSEDISSLLAQKSERHVVLADRFYTSTLAYQTIGLIGRRRQIMIKWIKWLCEQGIPRLPKPDLVILLDTTVDIAVQHLAKIKKDYFEHRQRLTNLRRSYLRLAKEDKWVVINSVGDRGQQRSIPDIHAEVWRHVRRLLF